MVYALHLSFRTLTGPPMKPNYRTKGLSEIILKGEREQRVMSFGVAAGGRIGQTIYETNYRRMENHNIRMVEKRSAAAYLEGGWLC